MFNKDTKGDAFRQQLNVLQVSIGIYSNIKIILTIDLNPLF